MLVRLGSLFLGLVVNIAIYYCYGFTFLIVITKVTCHYL